MATREYVFDVGDTNPLPAAGTPTLLGHFVTKSYFDGLLIQQKKQYVVGTAYTNGTPTMTGVSETYTVRRGVLIPYQSIDGTWFMKFNVTGYFAAASRTTAFVRFSGVVFKNVANFYQPIQCCIEKSIARGQGYAKPNTGDLEFGYATQTTTNHHYSGHVELNDKPSWAD